MKHFVQIIDNLPQYRQLYHLARAAFWILVTSVIAAAAFALFAHDPYHACQARIEQDSWSGLKYLEIYCSGFPYANAVGSSLRVFLNLIVTLPGCIFFIFVYVTGVTGGLVWNIIGLSFLLIMLTGTLLLDGLALLYLLYLCRRRTNTTSRICK